MPPPGRPRPDAATYRAVAVALEHELDAPRPRRPAIQAACAVHRLNRTEYTNAIRDLLGLEVDGARAVVVGRGRSGRLRQCRERAVGVAGAARELPGGSANDQPARGWRSVAAARSSTRSRSPRRWCRTSVSSDDLPFGSQGGALIRYHFPLDADYTIKVLLRRQEYDYIIGMGEPHQLDVRLDGVRVKRFTVGGEAKGMTTPENFAGNTQGDPEWEEYMHTADAQLEVRVPVKAGVHEVGVSFVRRFWEQEGVLQPPQTGFGRTTNEYYHGNPAVELVLIGGPYGAPAAGDSPSRRRIFVCRPKDAAAEEPCAQKILSTLAARAYRRPVTDERSRHAARLLPRGRAAGDFDAGIQRGHRTDPRRAELSLPHRTRASRPAPGAAYRLSDLDLASRLSFFLWSSIPDDELLNAAARGRLNDAARARAAGAADAARSASQALVDNFASRWLELNKLAGVVPDTELYPEFDENLREAMEQETQALRRQPGARRTAASWNC